MGSQLRGGRELDDLVERELVRIASPGGWLDGDQRVALAEVARRSRWPDTPRSFRIGREFHDCATAMAEIPSRVDHSLVDRWEADGITRLELAELTGVVARTVALDITMTGLGSELVELPEPKPGDPSHRVIDRAQMRGAFVPTIGPPRLANALSCVPGEGAAVADALSVLYLTPVEIDDPTVDGDLPRPLLDLAALRAATICRAPMVTAQMRTRLERSCAARGLAINPSIAKRMTVGRDHPPELDGVVEILRLVDAVSLLDPWELDDAREAVMALAGSAGATRVLTVVASMAMLAVIEAGTGVARRR